MEAASLPKCTAAPKLTTELYTIPLEAQRYILYAPLRRAAFITNARVVNFLVDLKEGFLDMAADPDGSLVNFLRNLEILDSSEEQLPVTTFSGPPKPTAVTLFSTTSCNLRCTYCYAFAGDMPARSMTFETAKRGIDFIVRNALERGCGGIEVNFHGGGEATTNWHVLTRSVGYAQRKAAQYRLELESSIATNGVLNDRKIAWITRNLTGASLSYDGLPEIHDEHRVTATGQGSSPKVLHTMKRFEEAGFPYGVRITVTHRQISRLPESVHFVCSRFHPTRIQVEPAYQMGRWANAPSAETAAFIEAYRKAQKAAAELKGSLSFSAARLGLLSNHFCGISQDNFSLAPDGNVTACYEVFSGELPWSGIFFYGRPDEGTGGYVFDFRVLNHLRSQGVENRKFCRDCFAKWTCAGDCYHKSLTVNGAVEFAGTDRCRIIRELTKDQILEKIALSGGLFWHEGGEAGGNAEFPRKEILL